MEYKPLNVVVRATSRRRGRLRPPSRRTAMAGGKAMAKKGGGNGKDNTRAFRFGLAFVLAVVAVFVVWLFASGTAGSFFDALGSADKTWFALAVLCFVAYFLLDVVCYRCAGMLAGVRMGLLDLLSTAASGVVFGYLTPGQCGGPPAQIVRLSQSGLKVGDATAVQLTKFFIYQAAVTVLGGTVLVSRFSFFEEAYGNVVLVSFFAFSVHVLIMSALVAVVFFPNLVRRVAHLCVKLLSWRRLRILKDPEAMHARVDDEVDSYAGATRSAVGHPGVVAIAIVITLMQLVFLYLVPYCVVHALGGSAVGLVDSVCAAAFVQLIMTAVPLPGGTGGAEGGFAVFFGGALGPMTTVGVVLWRFVTFYGPVVACSCLLGLRSKLTPADRYREFGEAHVGYEGVRDSMRIARRRSVELRDVAQKKLRLINPFRGRTSYVVVRGSGLAPASRGRRGAGARRPAVRRRTATLRIDDLAAAHARDRGAGEGAAGAGVRAESGEPGPEHAARETTEGGC